MAFGYQVLGFGSAPVTAAAGLAWLGNRGVFCGGSHSVSNMMEYVTIATPGNTTDFGDLVNARNGHGACSNVSRGVIGAGYYSGGTPRTTNCEYFTFASPANATDFGELTTARSYCGNALSDGTKGVWIAGNIGGGAPNYGYNETIDYLNIASLGDAEDFGDMPRVCVETCGANNATRGCVFGGNYVGGTWKSAFIDYFTFASLGNATDFGDLAIEMGGASGTGDGTTAVCAGGAAVGGADMNDIQYFAIATLGNSTDFGNLSLARRDLGDSGMSDGTYGVFAGGGASGSHNDTIDYITIATPGDASDFGNLDFGRSSVAGASGD
jgi:hypothetical protein